MTVLLMSVLIALPADDELTAMAENPPLGITLMPPKIDLEKYLQPPKPPVKCESDMTVFDPDPTPLAEEHTITTLVDGKRVSWRLRPGMLISECGFVEIINMKAEHKRMKTELGAMQTLREHRHGLWQEAELQYQNRILGLENENMKLKETSFWDEWKAPIMYGLGIGTALGLVAGTAYIIDSIGDDK